MKSSLVWFSDRKLPSDKNRLEVTQEPHHLSVNPVSTANGALPSYLLDFSFPDASF